MRSQQAVGLLVDLADDGAEHVAVIVLGASGNRNITLREPGPKTPCRSRAFSASSRRIRATARCPAVTSLSIRRFDHQPASFDSDYDLHPRLVQHDEAAAVPASSLDDLAALDASELPLVGEQPNRCLTDGEPSKINLEDEEQILVDVNRDRLRRRARNAISCRAVQM